MFSRLKLLISSVNVVRLVAPIIERKHKMCINIGDYFIIVLYSSMQLCQVLMNICPKSHLALQRFTFVLVAVLILMKISVK